MNSRHDPLHSEFAHENEGARQAEGLQPQRSQPRTSRSSFAFGALFARLQKVCRPRCFYTKCAEKFFLSKKCAYKHFYYAPNKYVFFLITKEITCCKTVTI